MVVSKVTYLWDMIRGSLWFIPGVMSLAALILASVAAWLDELIGSKAIIGFPLIYSGDQAGARAILSTVAGSMITIAGVVFSMTIVSLQLASSQFGPRLLRSFIRDRGNQLVLGTFISTFVYCIALLRSVGSHGGNAFVPHLAVTIGVILALTSLGVLVYFINHLAQSMRASSIVDAVSDELRSTIDRLFPKPIGESPERVDHPEQGIASAYQLSTAIRSPRSGYLAYINGETLMNIAESHDLVIRIETLPGRFIFEHDQLAVALSREPLDEQALKALVGAFTLRPQRTALQDVEFVFAQLVEMAVRALSPGINDPFTATNCMHYAAMGLREIARRPMPSMYRYHEETGRLRTIARPIPFSLLVEDTLEMIRHHATQEPMVLFEMLDLIERIAGAAIRRDDRRMLANMAQRVARTVRQLELDEQQSAVVETTLARMTAEINAPAG